MKKLIWMLSLQVLGASLVFADEVQLRQRLAHPLLHQGLVNSANYDVLNRLSRNYPRQNTLNVGWLAVFRRYNSGETLQNRTALDSHISESQLLFDMDGDRPLDWTQVRLDGENNANFSAAQCVLSLEISNIARPGSPVVLILLSNQHVINDYLSNPASKMLTRQGYTVAVLEYPNYGASLGRAGLESWLSAIRGAAKFLNGLAGRKIYLVGHSIGGPLALQAAASDEVAGQIAGVISYGGFSDLYAMAADNVSDSFLKVFSKPITFVTLRDNIIDGMGSLDGLVRRSVPALIMHGAWDGAVPPTHLESYQREILRLESSYGPRAGILETALFPEFFHEEINNFTDVRPTDFLTVWERVRIFMETVAGRPLQGKPPNGISVGSSSVRP